MAREGPVSERERVAVLAARLLGHKQLPGLEPFDLLRLIREVEERGAAAGERACVRFLVWVCDLPEEVAPIGHFTMDDFGRLEQWRVEILADWLRDGDLHAYDFGRTLMDD